MKKVFRFQNIWFIVYVWGLFSFISGSLYAFFGISLWQPINGVSDARLPLLIMFHMCGLLALLMALIIRGGRMEEG